MQRVAEKFEWAMRRFSENLQQRAYPIATQRYVSARSLRLHKTV